MTTTIPTLKPTTVHPSKIEAGDFLINDNGSLDLVTDVGEVYAVEGFGTDSPEAGDHFRHMVKTAGRSHWKVIVGDKPNPLMKEEFRLKPSHACVVVMRPASK